MYMGRSTHDIMKLCIVIGGAVSYKPCLPKPILLIKNINKPKTIKLTVLNVIDIPSYCGWDIPCSSCNMMYGIVVWEGGTQLL